MRVRWDLNPRSPAPKADTLIRARLRTHHKKRVTKILINQPDINLGVSRQRAGSSARLERSTDNRKVAGSNPARPTTENLVNRKHWQINRDHFGKQ